MTSLTDAINDSQMTDDITSPNNETNSNLALPSGSSPLSNDNPSSSTCNSPLPISPNDNSPSPLPSLSKLSSLTTDSTSITDHTSLLSISKLLSVLTDRTKALLGGLYQLHPQFNEVPSIDSVFVHSRSFIVKCHSLGEYISDEVKYMSTAFEENDMESYVDFLKEVSSKILSCQKDFAVLTKSLKSDVKPQLLAQEEKRHSEASKKANVGTVVAVTGGVTAGAGLGSLAIGLQSVILLPVGLMIGASLLTAGAVTAYKGRNIYHDSKKKERSYQLTVLLFEILETNIDIIESNFKSTMTHIGTNHSLAFSNKERFMRNLEEVKNQSKKLMGFTCPLKDEETLEDFILLCSYELEN